MIHCCPQCTRFYDCLAERRGYICGTPDVWRCPGCAVQQARGQGCRNYPEITIAYLSKEEAQLAVAGLCWRGEQSSYLPKQISEFGPHGIIAEIASAPSGRHGIIEPYQNG